MHAAAIRSIEEWLANHEDGEFCCGPRTAPYSVIAPMTERGCFLFTTKPRVVLPALEAEETADECGIIGRYGLPSRTDADWIGRILGTRALFFLGDMDPVDLMVFAWLRECLEPRQVRFAGINETLLRAAGVSASREKEIFLALAPSEQDSLPLLRSLLPDLDGLVGPRGADLWKRGRKIELEALGAGAVAGWRQLRQGAG